MLIPGKILNAIGVAAKETWRKGLNGMHLRRTPEGRAIVETCDGRLGIQAAWDELDARDWPSRVKGFKADPVKGFSSIVPADAVRQAAKSLPRRARLPILECVAVNEKAAAKNGHVPLMATDLEADTVLTPEKIDETYPDMDTLFQQGEPTAMFGINVEYLENLCFTLKRMGVKHAQVEVFSRKDGDKSRGTDQPIRIAAMNDDRAHIRGIIMPVMAEWE